MTRCAVPTWLRNLGLMLPDRLREPVRAVLAGAAPGRGIVLPSATQPLLNGSAPIGFVLRSAAGTLVAPPRTSLASQPRATAPDALRCLIVTGSLDVGGMDEVVAFLARRLPRLDISTAVLHARSERRFVGSPSGRLARLLMAQGVPVQELDRTDGKQFLRTWAPDVVSGHGAPDWVLEQAVAAGVPYVDTLHGMHTLFQVDWAQEAERSRSLAGVVAVSEMVRAQYLRGNAGYDDRAVVTIPNGVDGERRTPPDRARARQVLGLGEHHLFVSLARHCLQKNTFGLISAFAELAAHRPEAHLLVAGRPDDPLYTRRVLDLRSRSPHAERIHVRDHAGDPAALLAAADTFVLDSFFEGWSLASMEALCAGVPVVISEVGGAREQLGDDARRGLLVRNPSGGPPDQMSWASLSAVKYAEQPNRHELVRAMDRMVAEGPARDGRRAELAEESQLRFSAGACLDHHARVLRAAAAGRPLSAAQPVLPGSS